MSCLTDLMNKASQELSADESARLSRERERMRSKARHDEAQALRKARLEEREQWQGVVAEKDAALAKKDTALAKKDAEIARLRAQLKK